MERMAIDILLASVGKDGDRLGHHLCSEPLFQVS